MVAETFGRCLTAFERGASGDLEHRRPFAELGDRTPDGICLDIERGVWVSSGMTPDVVRVVEGGERADREEVSDDKAAAVCQIGGAANRTLYCLTYQRTGEDFGSGARSARIETVTVAVPGAGSP